MAKKKPSVAQFLSTAVLLFAFLTWFFYDVPPQIPYRQFISHHLANTTQIDRYGRNSALIYLNNNTIADYSVHISNETDFLYQLDTKNYKYQLYNSTRFNFINDFIRSLLLLLFLVLLVNHRMGGFGNFVEIENTSSTKLSDVAGLEDIKKEVFEFVDFLKKREEYTKVGARIPRGALFYGPPRNRQDINCESNRRGN